MAEIFQSCDQNIKHVKLSIAAHRMRFLGIAALLEHSRCVASQRVAGPIPAMVCDASRVKFPGKWPNSSQRVAGALKKLKIAVNGIAACGRALSDTLRAGPQ